MNTLNRFTNFDHFLFHSQLESLANRQRPGHSGQRAMGVGHVHVRRVDHSVLQTLEEHRIVRSHAAPDRHASVRRVGNTFGPIPDAGRCERRTRIFSVQTPMGVATGLEGINVALINLYKCLYHFNRGVEN